MDEQSPGSGVQGGPHRAGELGWGPVVYEPQQRGGSWQVPEGWISGFGFNMKISKKTTVKKHQPPLKI